MKEITLKSGYAFELDEKVVDNMELVDVLAEADNDEDPLAISKICTLLFGEHKKAIYDSFRTDGRVPLTDISEAIKSTFEQLGNKGKK